MTLSKRIIPCLDVADGQVVKGVKFKNIRNAGDPVTVAKHYADQGADEITFLDITASHENRNIIMDVVERVAQQIFIPLIVGGGVRNLEDIQNLLNAGADKVSINTAATVNPNLIQEATEHFGSQCIIVAIDAKRNQSGWSVYSHGGRENTGLDVLAWAQQVADYGAGEILLTSMDCDGTQGGFDCELTCAVSEAVHIPIIASGGVGTLDHLVDGIIKGKADAVLAASIFHFGQYSIAETKTYMQNNNITVRPITTIS